MSAPARLIGVAIAATGAVALGVLAAWPIYQSWWLVVAAAVGLIIGVGLAAFTSGRFGGILTTLLLVGIFVLTVVPVGVPQALQRLPGGLITGLFDGVVAIVTGWKQLLTLTLPVGSYQTVLVPAYLVFLLTAFIATTLALRTERFAPLAALTLPVPVLFGTVFGSSALSPALELGFVSIVAPREIGLWLAALLLGASWVWYSGGAVRRAALRRGRAAGQPKFNVLRVVFGSLITVVALFVGLAFAPVLDNGPRQIPRDKIDPEIVLNQWSSPLATYRAWKSDSSLDLPLFEVTSTGNLPERLRLAVLDDYDGVDFHVSVSEAGRFTRFPNSGRVNDPAEVTVHIADGYSDIWVPTAELGSVPVFLGARATELADSFFVNRGTGAAIALPGGRNTDGLAAGDGFTVMMKASQGQQLSGLPASDTPGVDLDSMPELATWLKVQDQPATADGLIELIERLRSRGYLSHSISESGGQLLWLDRLVSQYGTRFESSAGGHSAARLEQLFAQLNTQQRLAGEDAAPEALVAGIGDDEQFAAAAALIARALGFDSRVVLGVRLGGEGVPGVPACTEECTGEHLAAWVEVRGKQGDWVALDATPQVEIWPTRLEEGEQLPEFSTTPEERDAREVDPPLGLGERSDIADQAEQELGISWLLPLLRIVGLGAAALLFLLLPLLFLPIAKRRREASRRREADPELSALGAWRQLLDSAEDDGVVLPEGASRVEIATTLGTAPASWAAQTASKAVFSPLGVTSEEAEWMWQAVDSDREERRAAMSRWQRLRARYSLRSYGVKLVRSRSNAQESASAAQHEGQ